MTGQSRKRKYSPEELRQLIQLYGLTRDESLQEQLVTAYTPLVETLAKKFVRGQVMYEDLVQVGMIGLLASLRRFDPSFDRTFESFAIPTIVGEIKRYIRDKTWSVHVPRRVKELSPKIKRVVDELTAKLQRSPKISDIANCLGVTEEAVLETLEMGRSYHSLSMDSELEADNDGNTITLLDLVGQQEVGYGQVEQNLMLDRALHVLDKREKEIIHLTFYQNLSQKQAGDIMGMSQMHISRLQRRALGKLREALRVEQLETARTAT
ncbi:RNA polymerase sigma factor SigB [Brevibacillus parabrevis]|uniref:RNA polymerase sigma factor SigB n=1 Tax=Brevibacillus parabrevis TaxID=54914 RepID=UPI0011372DFD|nr:RNA polymerase sigma factor SigB [Brevibacillus parabrevis]MED1721229.1 RNA polymerase sigma factor SigB [Brevibacillus parabrevis]TGV28961.1 RNA polymerase sigma factor SigB [Mesorhizobium sp. M00.F.Ca.ET.186.01.1.1]